MLGRAYKRQAKFDQAREAFRRVVDSVQGRRTETAAQAQLMMAETFFLQKNYKQALLEYLKVYHLYAYPEWQAAGLFQAGLCDEMLGNWSDAAKTYELLLNQFPKSELAQQAERRLARIRKRKQSSGAAVN
ncbi:MAG: tetratricopeptide repeat protein [Planctomycetes bacterium]|nr:tetratricopeptide repeat protein [Planctomycetota bacterium]